MLRGRLTRVSLAALLLVLASCARETAPRSVLQRVVEVVDSAGAQANLRVRLRHAHHVSDDHVARAERAARAALQRYWRWFGPLPTDELIVDIPMSSDFVHPDDLWLETAVVQQLVRRWWGDVIRLRTADAPGLAEGLESYFGGFVLEELFAARAGVEGRVADQAEFFGGALTWTFPRLGLRRHTVRGSDERARVERTLLTLERHLGITAMERGVAVAAREFRGRDLTGRDLAATIGRAAGRDLSWFTAAVMEDNDFDYAVADITSSSVTVTRLGEGVFSGTSRTPIGPYETGRAIEIEVRFADGQRIVERWDGRAKSRRFEYAAPAAIVAAAVDPRATLVLDANRLNNTVLLTRRTPVPTARWIARWLGWMQHVLLTSALVL